MDKKREIVEGGGVYSKLPEAVSNITRGVCRPIPGTNLNDDEMVEFHLFARSDQRFR